MSTTGGQPAPSVSFVSPISTTTTGEILVSSATPFHFNSIEIHLCCLAAYEVIGTGPNGVVFRFGGYLPAPLGFTRVPNPYAAALVDQLSITLINPSSAFVANTIKVDNINVSH